MTKAELVEEVSRVSDLTKKHSELIVDTVFTSIIDALQRGEKIELRGFGSFRLRQREPRKGRNPKTGDKVDVPPKKVPYFKPGKELKELINKEPLSPPTRGWRPALDSRRLKIAVAKSAIVTFHPATFVDRLFSPWRLRYVTSASEPAPGCIFCQAADSAAQSDLVVARGRTAFVILNLFPYNSGHLMVVPEPARGGLGRARPRGTDRADAADRARRTRAVPRSTSRTASTSA